MITIKDAATTFDMSRLMLRRMITDHGIDIHNVDGKETITDDDLNSLVPVICEMRQSTAELFCSKEQIRDAAIDELIASKEA